MPCQAIGLESTDLPSLLWARLRKRIGWIANTGGGSRRNKDSRRLSSLVRSPTGTGMVNLFPDFKEFLKLLNSSEVRPLRQNKRAATRKGPGRPAKSSFRVRCVKRAMAIINVPKRVSATPDAHVTPDRGGCDDVRLHACLDGEVGRITKHLGGALEPRIIYDPSLAAPTTIQPE